MSLSRFLGAASLALVALGCGKAGAADLSWSHVGGSIGYCNFAPGAGNCSVPGQGNWVITDGGSAGGPNQNANGYLSGDWGSIYAAADPGGEQYGLPQLHAAVTVAEAQGPLIGRSNVGVQALQKYTWTGEAIDVDPNSLIGTLDYSSSSGLTRVGVGFAIIDSSLIGNPGLAAQWYQKGPAGLFAADCGTPGAVAIANPNRYAGTGEVAVSVAATACGDLHLETGDTFFVWSKLSLFRSDAGFIDASNTFSLGFAPEVTPEQRAYLTANLVATPFHVAVPEPGTWALMIVGFGLAGAALRRRRVLCA